MGERAHIGFTLDALIHWKNTRENERSSRRSRSTCWRRATQRQESHRLAHPLAAQETNDFPVGLTPPTSDVGKAKLGPPS